LLKVHSAHTGRVHGKRREECFSHKLLQQVTAIVLGDQLKLGQPAARCDGRNNESVAEDTFLTNYLRILLSGAHACKALNVIRGGPCRDGGCKQHARTSFARYSSEDRHPPSSAQLGEGKASRSVSVGVERALQGRTVGVAGRAHAEEDGEVVRGIKSRCA
jgi:hypothetical protein